MRNRRIRITSLVLSLCVHFVFILSSSVVTIPGVIIPPNKPQKLFRVKITREEAPRQFSQTTPKEKEIFRFESPSLVSSIESFLDKEQIVEKKTELPDETLTELVKVDPLADVVHTQRDSVLERPTKEAAERKTESVITEDIQLKYQDLIDKANDRLSEKNLLEDFIDKMPGVTPALVPDAFGAAKVSQQEDMPHHSLPVISRRKDVAELKGELSWSLATYQDPEDKQKYFKITIRAGEKVENLKRMSKEILFLVDYSKSVGDKILNEFKDGLGSVLKKLNPDDRFNIIIFKEIIFEFRKKSVDPTEENIKLAIQFLNEFKAGEKTDAFEVLSKTLKRKPLLNPSYMLMLSDGRPTKGVINPREVINKISKLNDGKKPIFTFSGGIRINRYLLDFIAFRNRAWSEYSYRTHQIPGKISAMYDKIDYPIILNLRYFITNIDDQETYPNVLPDFFRNAEFSLYGTFEDEENFVMQVLGDVQGKKREFLFQAPFREADQGDEEIAKNWGYNKIFDLIGQLRHDKDNQKLIKQIDEILKKFDLKTPYYEDILK